MIVFIRAMVRIFSFGERWNVPFNSAVASLNGTFHLSPHENILTIARIKTFVICIIYATETSQACSSAWCFTRLAILLNLAYFKTFLKFRKRRARA